MGIYCTLLFLNKANNCIYLDGALLMALGLRKQNVKHKIICMVTPDIGPEHINILKILYDDVIKVDYITPVKNKQGITIINDIFDKETYIDDLNYSSIAHVFTKLHIFNSNLFPYKKIIFIDTDIIPIKNYDELFNLETPSGWLEQILELKNDINSGYTRIWGLWENIKHGESIPKFLTNIHKIPGSCINAGLLVIEPDIKLFNFFIKQLQTLKYQ